MNPNHLKHKAFRHLLLPLLLSFSSSAVVNASQSSIEPSIAQWQQVVETAKGQKVYFHAWGGSQEINRYLQWTSRQLKQRYDVEFHHVKVSDIAETASRLIAEKAAGKNSAGSVDMVWINGENFKSMKDNQLLFGPFVEQLPNWQYVDKRLPVDQDFSEPTEGLEAPWGVGQLVFINDKQQLHNPPQSHKEMLAYAKAFPNRLSYPRPPEFHGTSYLKSLLIELTNNDPSLSQPVNEQDFELITAPLWDYLDQFHQVAWKQGKQFPSGTAETIQLLDDGQLDLAISFNPNAVFTAQNSGNLAESTYAYAMQQGALSNIHFLAIPWNSAATEGARVAINFLLSPEAQSRKGDLQIWGDPSVLNKSVLTGNAAQTEAFPSVSEPHPTWQAALEREWLRRYGS